DTIYKALVVAHHTFLTLNITNKMLIIYFSYKILYFHYIIMKKRHYLLILCILYYLIDKFIKGSRNPEFFTFFYYVAINVINLSNDSFFQILQHTRFNFFFFYYINIKKRHFFLILGNLY